MGPGCNSAWALCQVGSYWRDGLADYCTFRKFPPFTSNWVYKVFVLLRNSEALPRVYTWRYFQMSGPAPSRKVQTGLSLVWSSPGPPAVRTGIQQVVCGWPQATRCQDSWQPAAQRLPPSFSNGVVWMLPQCTFRNTCALPYNGYIKFWHQIEKKWKEKELTATICYPG